MKLMSYMAVSGVKAGPCPRVKASTPPLRATVGWLQKYLIKKKKSMGAGGGGRRDMGSEGSAWPFVHTLPGAVSDT